MGRKIIIIVLGDTQFGTFLRYSSKNVVQRVRSSDAQLKKWIKYINIDIINILMTLVRIKMHSGPRK